MGDIEGTCAAYFDGVGDFGEFDYEDYFAG
jgi:hypothetical protein